MAAIDHHQDTPPISWRWSDHAVADQFGVTVVWLRSEILNKVPGTCIRVGRSRFLTQRHIDKVEAVMEEMAAQKAEARTCPSSSTSAPRASGISAAPSKGSVWTKALELAQKK